MSEHDGLLQQGMALLKAGNAAAAVAPLAAALKAEPGSFQACLALGLALAQSQRLDQAAAALTKACQLNPAHALGQYQLGLVQQQRGDAAAARAAWQAALAIDPSLDKAKQALATLAPAPAAPPPPAAPAAPARATLGMSADELAAVNGMGNVSISHSVAPPPVQPQQPAQPQPAAQPAAPAGFVTIPEDDLVAPLGAPAPAPTAPAGPGVAPLAAGPEPPQAAVPTGRPDGPAPPDNKEVGRVENIGSNGSATMAELWDIVGTADKAYFVRVASSIPMILGVVLGILAGLVLVNVLKIDTTSQAGKAGQIYGVFCGGGMLAYLIVQNILLRAAAAAKRASIGKLTPPQQMEAAGGFAMDWNDLRNQRQVKGQLTVNTKSIRKSFSLKAKTDQLDKIMKSQTRKGPMV